VCEVGAASRLEHTLETALERSRKILRGWRSFRRTHGLEVHVVAFVAWESRRVSDGCQGRPPPLIAVLDDAGGPAPGSRELMKIATGSVDIGRRWKPSMAPTMHAANRTAEHGHVIKSTAMSIGRGGPRWHVKTTMFPFRVRTTRRWR